MVIIVKIFAVFGVHVFLFVNIVSMTAVTGIVMTFDHSYSHYSP